MLMKDRWLESTIDLGKKAAEMAEMFKKCKKVGCYTELDHYTTWLDEEYKQWLIQILTEYSNGILNDSRSIDRASFFSRHSSFCSTLF